jgi:hypothetical protein
MKIQIPVGARDLVVDRLEVADFETKTLDQTF